MYREAHHCKKQSCLIGLERKQPIEINYASMQFRDVDILFLLIQAGRF